MNRSNTLPARSIVRRHGTPDNHVMRSDTIQTSVSLSLNGNSDEVSEPRMDELLPIEAKHSSAETKSWASNRNSPVCCKVCVSEQREITPSPCYERQGLLYHSNSADSAC